MGMPKNIDAAFARQTPPATSQNFRRSRPHAISVSTRTTGTNAATATGICQNSIGTPALARRDITERKV
jgi:hypothetical protein